MFRKLEDNHSGSLDPTNGTGLQNTSDPFSTPMEIERDQSSITTAAPHGQCSSGVAQQSSNQAGPTSSGSVCVNFIPLEKENNSGQYRPVINLRALNQFVESQPFKMESLQVVKALVQPGDYLMKMDLKDAYYTSPSIRTAAIISDSLTTGICTSFVAYPSDSRLPLGHYKDLETSSCLDSFPGNSHCHLSAWTISCFYIRTRTT